MFQVLEGRPCIGSLAGVEGQRHGECRCNAGHEELSHHRVRGTRLPALFQSSSETRAVYPVRSHPSKGCQIACIDRLGLVGWSVGWSVGWLVGWLVGWCGLADWCLKHRTSFDSSSKIAAAGWSFGASSGISTKPRRLWKKNHPISWHYVLTGKTEDCRLHWRSIRAGPYRSQLTDWLHLHVANSWNVCQDGFGSKVNLWKNPKTFVSSFLHPQAGKGRWFLVGTFTVILSQSHSVRPSLASSAGKAVTFRHHRYFPSPARC